MVIVVSNRSGLEAGDISEVSTESRGVCTTTTVGAEERFDRLDSAPYGTEGEFANDIQPLREVGMVVCGAFDE